MQSSPLARRAARVLVVDPAERVLLLRAHDPARPDAGSWWTTPGGGLEAGETPSQAARRELAEETGLGVERLVGPVWHRAVHFEFDGLSIDQDEDFFLARVAGDLEVHHTGMGARERAAVEAWGWHDVATLAGRDDGRAGDGVAVFPSALGAALARLLADGPSAAPEELGP